jgi:adenine-specific DNA-methyltransferase
MPLRGLSLALVEHLISQIPDAALRKALEREVADLKKRLTWGLVFERHIPETTFLLDAPVRPGSVVWERRTTKPKRFRVRAVEGDQLTVVPETEGEAAPADAETQTLARADILVEKPFAEPVHPGLTSLGAVRRGPADRPSHAVIEGENFHALQLLVAAHEGQVDCVYFDPPYNTGAPDWKYNNRFVDATDHWRHSKWLSFMEKRLILAKRLLKPDGVLVVTIDEHEVHHLGMLMEQVFKGYLQQMVTIVINPKGTGKLNFARVEEHALFAIPNLGRSVIAGIPRTEKVAADALDAAIEEVLALNLAEEAALEAGEGVVATDAEAADVFDAVIDLAEPEEVAEATAAPADLPFPVEELPIWELRHARRRGGESSYRAQRPNQFYPLWINTETRKVIRAGVSIPLPEAPNLDVVDELTPVWPIDAEGNERCWRFVPDTMNELIAAGRVVLGRHNATTGSWTVNYWVRQSTTLKEKTVWWSKRHDAGTHGTTLLNAFLGTRTSFSFPKSVYAVADTLATVVRDRPDALIVDAFAGSGTTLHSTWLLNQTLGGQRRCILVTNNEVEAKAARRLARANHFRGDPEYEAEGVFQSVTKPRLKAALTGLRASDGKPIPGRYIDRTPYAQGYEENVEFFRLDYLDPADVELGLRFGELLPLWWLQAGGVGERDGVAALDPTKTTHVIPAGAPYAFLFDPSGMPALLAGLKERPDVTHAYITTDTDEAFADLAAQLPEQLVVTQLYANYLDVLRGMGA